VTRRRAVLGLMLATLVLTGVGAGTRVPYRFSESDEAVLRLSWRLRGVRVEECRRLTAGELERLPAHMRREEVCEGRIAPYRLTLEIDGHQVEDGLVHASGARADRPLYVYREEPNGLTFALEAVAGIGAFRVSHAEVDDMVWRAEVERVV
jgi:hypothetical protein